jgi:hypothetical protein
MRPIFLCILLLVLVGAASISDANGSAQVEVKVTQGAVIMIRDGKEETKGVGHIPAFTNGHQIRVLPDGRALLRWDAPRGKLSVELVGGSILEHSGGGTSEGEPLLMTLIAGHARVTLRGDTKPQAVDQLDLVRIRTPRGLFGVKSTEKVGGKGGAEALLHVVPDETQFYSLVTASAKRDLLKVTHLRDMNLYKNLYTRVDVALGTFLYKAEDQSAPLELAAGMSAEHVASRGDEPVGVSTIQKEERLKIRRALML